MWGGGPFRVQPRVALQAGKFSPVPLLGGFNLNDSSFIQFAMIYMYNVPHPFTLEDAEAVLSWYVHNGAYNAELLQTYADVFASFPSNFTAVTVPATDALFSVPLFEWAASMEAAGVPAYAYRFEHMPSFFPALLPAQALGVCHLTEIPFVFGNPCFASCEVPQFVGSFDAADLAVLRTVRGLWLDFAHGREDSSALERFGSDARSGPILRIPSLTVASASDYPVSFWQSIPPVVI